ncbi:MAG: DUF2141 domain-containing protein [Myxococcaceae bacterium]|nr:DUF2141 domain-containing protein [Myxococcaceae bacterium]
MMTTVMLLLAANPSLEVTITGLASDAGEVRLAVFSSREGWPERDELAVRRVALKIVRGRATVKLDDLPAGTYAAIAFHDADGDGKLKKGLFGAPQEAWGASNGARAALGPKFEAAAFVVQGDTRISFAVEG